MNRQDFLKQETAHKRCVAHNAFRRRLSATDYRVLLPLETHYSRAIVAIKSRERIYVNSSTLPFIETLLPQTEFILLDARFPADRVGIK